jgi:hypothetical protein
VVVLLVIAALVALIGYLVAFAEGAGPPPTGHHGALVGPAGTPLVAVRGVSNADPGQAIGIMWRAMPETAHRHGTKARHGWVPPASSPLRLT